MACDVTPASLKPTTLGGFGRRAIEEMNISGEHPVSLLSLDVATVRLRGTWQFELRETKVINEENGQV